MNIRRVVVGVLLILVIGSTVGLRNIPQTKDIDSTEFLQPGDILFVDIHDGWCIWGYWDHIAIYVGEQIIGAGYRDRAVVEATFNGGITLTQVDSFCARDRPAEVYVKRLKDISGRERIIREAVEYALAQDGKPFDSLVLPPNKIGDEALHCGEVIWRAYKEAGIDLDSNGGLMLLPDDIYYSPYLESI